MRLVDADELEKEEEYDPNFRLVIPASKLDRAPTIDAAPVAHAHWQYLGDDAVNGVAVYACTNCRGECGISFHGEELKKYCGDCGARMDEEKITLQMPEMPEGKQ